MQVKYRRSQFFWEKSKRKQAKEVEVDRLTVGIYLLSSYIRSFLEWAQFWSGSPGQISNWCGVQNTQLELI